jgi:hypothetical protein
VALSCLVRSRWLVAGKLHVAESKRERVKDSVLTCEEERPCRHNSHCCLCSGCRTADLRHIWLFLLDIGHKPDHSDFKQSVLPHDKYSSKREGPQALPHLLGARGSALSLGITSSRLSQEVAVGVIGVLVVRQRGLRRRSPRRVLAM